MEAKLLRQRRRDRLSPAIATARRPRERVRSSARTFTILVYGDAFWPTYTTGDNTGLIATDSMKNFVQREMLNYEGSDLEDCCRFLGAKFLATYPQVEGVQMSAVEIPYAALPESDVAFAPAGPDRASARLELNRDGVVEIASGISGFKLLRLGGSAFHGFVRDQYTTLPDIANRPLHMWLDLEWLYTEPSAGFQSGRRHRGRAAHRARGFSRIRIRQHPAGDLSDRNENAGGYSRASPKCIWKRTTGPGTPSPSAATNSAFTPKRGLPSAVLGLRLKR